MSERETKMNIFETKNGDSLDLDSVVFISKLDYDFLSGYGFHSHRSDYFVNIKAEGLEPFQFYLVYGSEGDFRMKDTWEETRKKEEKLSKLAEKERLRLMLQWKQNQKQ